MLPSARTDTAGSPQRQEEHEAKNTFNVQAASCTLRARSAA